MVSSLHFLSVIRRMIVVLGLRPSRRAWLLCGRSLLLLRSLVLLLLLTTPWRIPVTTCSFISFGVRVLLTWRKKWLIRSPLVMVILLVVRWLMIPLLILIGLVLVIVVKRVRVPRRGVRVFRLLGRLLLLMVIILRMRRLTRRKKRFRLLRR